MLWSNLPSPIPHHSLPPTSRKIYFMILTEVCFIQVWISPSHAHRFMVSSLMDSGTNPPLHVPHQFWPLIFTTSSYLIPPPRFRFLSTKYHYHLRHNSPHTHATFPFHIWYSNAVTTFDTNPYPQQYHLQVHSATSLR